ncbi:MAG: hypothetical protein HYV08_00855 [Deltaproteobacteria bacterium]|nr:hypothetical protein [Deltaproteobacteria bacterium]
MDERWRGDHIIPLIGLVVMFVSGCGYLWPEQVRRETLPEARHQALLYQGVARETRAIVLIPEGERNVHVQAPATDDLGMGPPAQWAEQLDREWIRFHPYRVKDRAGRPRAHVLLSEHLRFWAFEHDGEVTIRIHDHRREVSGNGNGGTK